MIAFAGLVSIAAVLLLAFVLDGHSFPAIADPSLWAPLAALAVVGAYLERAGSTEHLRRVGAASQAIAAWWFAMLLGTIATITATPLGGQLQDGLLSLPERLLGYTQADAHRLVSRAGVGPLLGLVYSSLPVQAQALALWHGFIHPRPGLLWATARDTAALSIVGVLLYLCLPAAGPFVAYAYEGPAPSFVEPFALLRAGLPTTIEAVDGFVAAPSFHVIVTAILLRLWVQTPLWPVGVAIAVLQVPATWVVGWHYLSDLLLGAALAGGAWLLGRAS